MIYVGGLLLGKVNSVPIYSRTSPTNNFLMGTSYSWDFFEVQETAHSKMNT